MLLSARGPLHPSWDGMCRAMLAALAWASQQGQGRVGRWLGTSLGPSQWQQESMAGSLWPETSLQLSRASTHPKIAAASTVSGPPWWMLPVCHREEGGAIFGLWVPFGKSRHGLKGLGLRRGTGLLQGNSRLKGCPLTPPAPQAPSSLVALASACFAHCTGERCVPVCLEKHWHPAPTLGSGASGMFGEEGGSQSRLKCQGERG